MGDNFVPEVVMNINQKYDKTKWNLHDVFLSESILKLYDIDRIKTCSICCTVIKCGTVLKVNVRLNYRSNCPQLLNELLSSQSLLPHSLFFFCWN